MVLPEKNLSSPPPQKKRKALGLALSVKKNSGLARPKKKELAPFEIENRGASPIRQWQATEARHERTRTQGRTQFVVCGRDSPTPEPFGERGLPALQDRGPAAAGRGPFRAVSPARAICDTAPESSPRER